MSSSRYSKQLHHEVFILIKHIHNNNAFVIIYINKTSLSVMMVTVISNDIHVVS